MTIEWRPQDGQFHLSNGRISLVLRVYEDGSLGQIHLGAPLPKGRTYRHLGPDPFDGFSNRVGDPVPFAYPTPGTGDFRVPALVAAGPDGATALALRYREHRIMAGKPSLDPLPATYCDVDDEAQTLVVTLVDDPTGLEVDLRTTIFAERPLVALSATIRAGSVPMDLRTAMSVSVDLPDADWTMIGLAGAWAREAHVVERVLAPGRQSVSSTRGISGAQHNPFLALRRPSADDARGEVFGFSLVYSGNSLAEAEVEPFGTTRVRLGIEPDTFGWHLGQGESFTTPEAIVVHSTDGLGGLSDALHDLFRDRLARGAWRDRPRPVLLNNWEGTYYDFDADRLVAMALSARDLGVELFVLDDGWFGHRDDDTTSLGDWVVDRRKLPDGLGDVASRITGLGMGFGMWIEPEMVSSDSDLFRAHPDWAIGIPDRPRTESRHQLVLDMGRPEVVDHLATVLNDVLGSAPISYVKWDMNRYVTEPFGPTLRPDRQGEFFHRYILGVYELYRRLTTRFPAILFESCASGGGRFDPGMLAFAPQAWTSDDTDAIERLRSQWGTSLAYPLSSMAAHVSAVPNHQTGRITPLATRAAVAFFGVLGYELDPTMIGAADRTEIAEQVAFYVRHREVLQRGRFVRLESPFSGERDHVSWMALSPDRATAIIGVYQILNRPAPEARRLRLRGLEPTAVYRVSGWPVSDDSMIAANTGPRTGAELMAAGLVLDRERHYAATLGDFWARVFVLERVESDQA
ncbi:MAG: alpha-galactosidase [Thermomicrobiales bacterium]|nr:MAG: alpha-galactosidase [Thermomicrobiales bacterium]